MCDLTSGLAKLSKVNSTQRAIKVPNWWSLIPEVQDKVKWLAFLVHYKMGLWWWSVFCVFWSRLIILWAHTEEGIRRGLANISGCSDTVMRLSSLLHPSPTAPITTQCTFQQLMLSSAKHHFQHAFIKTHWYSFLAGLQCLFIGKSLLSTQGCKEETS